MLINPISGKVVLRGVKRGKKMQVQPLSPVGVPIGEPADVPGSGDGWEIPVGIPATVVWRLDIR